VYVSLKTPNTKNNFFLIGKQIALKKRKGAPKHTWSIQKGHQNKRKTKNRRRTPEKPKRQ
jgi:hypothetical protein